jgi:hypothetical protein
LCFHLLPTPSLTSSSIIAACCRPTFVPTTWVPLVWYGAFLFDVSCTPWLSSETHAQATQPHTAILKPRITGCQSFPVTVQPRSSPSGFSGFYCFLFSVRSGAHRNNPYLLLLTLVFRDVGLDNISTSGLDSLTSTTKSLIDSSTVYTRFPIGFLCRIPVRLQ